MRLRFCAIACLAAVVTGCAGKTPPTHYYTLNAVAGETGRAEGPALLVGPFVVDPPYDQDRLVYRRGAGAAEVGFYNYHRWAAPLGRLVAVAVAAGLERLPGVGVAEPTATRPRHDARLTGRVIQLEEVDTESGAEVRIAIDFRLEDGSGELLWSGVLTATATGPSVAGSDAMALVERAFDRMVRQLGERVSAALESATG